MVRTKPTGGKSKPLEKRKHTPQESISAPSKKPRIQQPLRGTSASAPPPPSSPPPTHPPPKETTLEDDFDRWRFKTAHTQRLYNKKVKYKEIVELWLFDCKSLEDTRLYSFRDFATASIYKFCRFSCDYSPEIIREFYTSIFIEDHLMKFYVKGVEFMVDEKLLAQLFQLNNNGKSINHEIRKESREGPTMLANVEEMVQNLLKSFKEDRV